MRRDDLLPGEIWVDHGLLSPDECAAWIARGEAVGYEAAPITTPMGFVMSPDIRNNTRVIIDDAGAAEALWAVASARVPPRIDGAEAVGLNERFRLYRYDPGEYFAPHADGFFQRANGDRSRLTLIYYLNDGFVGGETRFFPPGAPDRDADRGLGALLPAPPRARGRGGDGGEKVRPAHRRDVPPVGRRSPRPALI